MYVTLPCDCPTPLPPSCIKLWNIAIDVTLPDMSTPSLDKLLHYDPGNKLQEPRGSYYVSVRCLSRLSAKLKWCHPEVLMVSRQFQQPKLTYT